MKLSHLVALSLAVPGALTCLPHTARAEVLVIPTIMDSATPYDGNYLAANLFDGTPNDYASQGLGVDTWVTLDFGSAVTMDRMILATRRNAVDVIGSYRLILSNDPDFSTTVGDFTFNDAGDNGHGPIKTFASTTARYARWQVVTSVGTGQNLGGTEMRFLNTPTGSQAVTPTVIGGSPAYSEVFQLANAANNDAGSSFDNNGPGIEYASAGAGDDMFVDFDLGSINLIVGFDFFDRLAVLDRTVAFDLVFSNTPDFSSIVETLSFFPGAEGLGWGYSETFDGVNARYVRLDAVVGFENNGMSEMIFYTAVPEPATWSLIAGGMLLILGIRHRRSHVG